MRERLRLANGTLDIESAPGNGTAVIAWVPAQEGW
jgi:signal transduction histidine kinase